MSTQSYLIKIILEKFPYLKLKWRDDENILSVLIPEGIEENEKEIMRKEIKLIVGLAGGEVYFNEYNKIII